MIRHQGPLPATDRLRVTGIRPKDRQATNRAATGKMAEGCLGATKPGRFEEAIGSLDVALDAATIRLLEAVYELCEVAGHR